MFILTFVLLLLLLLLVFRFPLLLPKLRVGMLGANAKTKKLPQHPNIEPGVGVGHGIHNPVFNYNSTWVKLSITIIGFASCGDCSAQLCFGPFHFGLVSLRSRRRAQEGRRRGGRKV